MPVWMETFGVWGLVPIISLLIAVILVALFAKGRKR
jgi:hypothetical protein